MKLNEFNLYAEKRRRLLSVEERVISALRSVGIAFCAEQDRNKVDNISVNNDSIDIFIIRLEKIGFLGILHPYGIHIECRADAVTLKMPDEYDGGIEMPCVSDEDFIAIAGKAAEMLDQMLDELRSENVL